MKNNKIKLFAMQVPCDEELEENEVFVEFNVEELLNQIESSDVYDYATERFGLVNEDGVAIKLDDFYESDLIEHLRDNYYNFIKEVDTNEMIKHLESLGYSLDNEFFNKDEYDYIDSILFEEISTKFHSLSVFDRQKLRDLIINF